MNMKNFYFVTMLLWSSFGTFAPFILASSVPEFLEQGDAALSQDRSTEAIGYYKQGLQVMEESTKEESLISILSLHTNMATALSSVGQNQEAADYYKKPLVAYANKIDSITDEDVKKDATDIAAQASFFLGMVYQDLEQYRDSVDAYSQAHVLDPNHWASLANLAAVLHDSMSQHRQALRAYNQAYEILTSPIFEPTDAPAEPRYILSQLQYRIGLCISHDLNAKCAMEDAPDKQVSCKELATNAFARAIEYDPDNESARHMLATITADATMSRASNTYIKSLFDDYAQK